MNLECIGSVEALMREALSGNRRDVGHYVRVCVCVSVCVCVCCVHVLCVCV